MVFNHFASIYDLVMDHDLYDQWAGFAIRSFEQENKPVQKVLELACGTGELANRLYQAGYQVTGLDLSQEMLEMARHKFPENDRLSFVQGDMLALDFDQSFEAITLFSDSLCYLISFDDQVQALTQAYRCLEEGGILLFDTHSLYQMEEVFPGYQFIDQGEGWVFNWQSFEGELPGGVDHQIDLYLAKDEDETLFEHFQEIHQEQTYPMDWYLQALEEIGFSQVQVLADFGQSPVSDQSPRWFFKAVK